MSGDAGLAAPVTADEALAIVAAARSAAEQQGVIVSIAVVDAHGGLIAQLTLDGAKFISAEIARGKAYASAAFRQDTAALEEKAVSRDKALFYTTAAATQDGRIVISQGGLVIWRDGRVCGAVGVSGTTPQGDEAIALAAVQAAGFSRIDREQAIAIGEARTDRRKG